MVRPSQGLDRASIRFADFGPSRYGALMKIRAEVTVCKLLEVHLVNSIAPLALTARLKPLVLRVASQDKHVVNVSAREGQLDRRLKTTRHLHMNMAKASPSSPVRRRLRISWSRTTNSALGHREGGRPK